MAPARTIRVTLLRHGVAADREGWKGDDLLRPLTDKGAKRVRAVARGLRALGVRPKQVLTSPALRTVETAKLAALELRVPGERVREEPALAPGGAVEDLLGMLSALDVDEVLCVGHAPQLDEVLAALLGLRHGRGTVALKKAGAALVQLSADRPGRGRLRALLSPALLRRLGKHTAKR